jgi:beta-glucosidase
MADQIRLNNIPEQVNYFNELQKIAMTHTRLKIPLLQDMFPGATVFPEGLTLGSTFDMPLVGAMYAAEAQEARSTGIHALSALVLETERDPRIGRNMKGYTEAGREDLSFSPAETRKE